jgi:hypothetical protein
MLHPELTRALAEQHIQELHQRAAQRLPVTPHAARFQGLQTLVAGLGRLHRRARTASGTAASAACAAAAPVVSNVKAATSGPAEARRPMGCVA